MGNTWNNAGNPQIYLNENAITDSAFSVAANTNQIATGKIDLGNEETNDKGRVILEVRAQSNDATIQMNYITIAPYRETADLSGLQELYNETKDTQQENYTARSWSAFQEALSAAEALLMEDSEASLPFTRQAEVNEAQRTLKSAFQALVLISEVQDSELLYFVDCGDHDPETLTGKDKLGIYNSVTDQLYGTDAVSYTHLNAVRIRSTKNAGMLMENWALQPMAEEIQAELLTAQDGMELRNGKLRVCITNGGKITMYNQRGELLLEEYWRNRRDVTDSKCSAIEVEAREMCIRDRYSPMKMSFIRSIQMIWWWI